MLFVTSRRYSFEDSCVKLVREILCFLKSPRGQPSTFLNVETNEQLFNIFLDFSNDLATDQELGKLVGVPLFLWLEGPWINSRNLTTHLIFGFWK
jgi:hypothetical protein